VASYRRLVEKTLSNALEVKARGANVLMLTTESIKMTVEHASDNIITIPDIHDVLLPSLAVLPLQLFAYYVALYRGWPTSTSRGTWPRASRWNSLQ
jgi:glucosamine--fructose-6-phosphate aminotransferase (isomerizing)